jgi:hypothetical protein
MPGDSPFRSTFPPQALTQAALRAYRTQTYTQTMRVIDACT